MLAGAKTVTRNIRIGTALGNASASRNGAARNPRKFAAQ
jgi:hypothetical protein